MTTRILWAVGLLLAVGAPSLRADDGKDTYGDPLPKGAKARLGTERMRNLDSYSVLMPDGKAILSQSSSGISTIDPSTGLVTGKLPAPKGGYALQPTIVSADGKRGAALSYDRITMLDLETGKKLCEVKRSGYSSDGMAYLSADGKILAIGGNVDDKAKDKGVSVRLWNVDDDKEIASIKVAQNNSARAVLSADGKTLATWGYHSEPTKPGTEYDPEADPNRHIQLWDAEGKALSTIRNTTTLSAVALSPDGQTVAVASYGSTKLFTAKTGELKKQLLGRSGMGRMVQFSGDGKSIAAVADDGGAVQIWDVATGKSLGIGECPPLSGGTYLNLRGLSFPTGDRLVAFGLKGVAGIVWEVPTGKRLSPAGGHMEMITGVGFGAGDKEVLTTSFSGQIVRWDLAGKELGTIPLRIPGAAAQYANSDRVQFAPGGAMAYRSDSGLGIGIYDLPSGLQRYSLPNDGTYSSLTAFSKSGKVAMVIPGPYSTKPKPGKLAVFDISKNEATGIYPMPIGNVTMVALTADGGKIAIIRRVDEKGKAKNVLTGFDTATGKQVSEMPLEDSFGSYYLATTPGKDRVLLVDPKEGLLDIDVGTGKKVRTVIEGNIGLAMVPVMSEDEKFIAIATGSVYSTNPSTIEVREFESGKLLHKFTGHSKSVTAMGFSKDGKLLATASADTTILLWDLTGEKE